MSQEDFENAAFEPEGQKTEKQAKVAKALWITAGVLVLVIGATLVFMLTYDNTDPGELSENAFTMESEAEPRNHSEDDEHHDHEHGSDDLHAHDHSHGPAYSGDTREAVWEVRNYEDLTPEAETIEIAVTRIACSSGETGEVEDVEIELTEDEIILTAKAIELDEDEDHHCEANIPTYYEVDLGEPIGERDLIDGHENAIKVQAGYITRDVEE